MITAFETTVVSSRKPIIDALIQEAHRFGMIQNEEEVRMFLDWYGSIPVKRLMEIGTHTGGFLSLLMEMGSEKELAISVDLPWQEHEYSVGNFREEYKDRVKFIVGDSHSPETWGAVHKITNGRLIDFLFLDGDHSLKGIAQDWTAFSPLVRPGGWIGFHDINNGHECGRFYRDVAIQDRAHVEFGFGRTFGIGCVRV